MVFQFIQSEMRKEADALEAKLLELQRPDSALMMQCPHCQKKIDLGFTFGIWCMYSLGACAHHDKAGGDSSLAQDVAGVRATSGNKPTDAPSQRKFNEFFVKQIHARSAWAKKAKNLENK